MPDPEVATPTAPRPAAPTGATGRDATPRLVRARARSRPSIPGFSLIEVVLVIVILATIAAIAIPRLSRGSQGSAEAALSRDVQVLQKAIDLYAAEHNGAFPDGARITDQLTLYTDASGSASKAKSPPFEFGPYMRKVPPIPAGPNKGNCAISTTAGVGVGWIYDPTEGTITPNNTAVVAGTQPSSPATSPAP